MRYVIIGGSIAGISAARSVRGLDTKGNITVISEEKTKAYYRPMIPFLIEKDDVDISFEDDPVEKFNISAVYDKAEGIDTDAKKVTLASGKKIDFDKLMIATGSRPVIPDIKGLKGSGAFTLRTKQDALSIHKYVPGRKAAVVLGCGLVGIKTAIALNHLGIKVTMAEQLPQILFRRLDKRGSQIISNRIKDAGIDILTNETAEEIIRKGGGISAVRLSSGEKISADLVVVAAGAKPNTDFLKDSGIKTSQGIIINEQLQAGSPDVYAAGDVVEYIDLVSNSPAVSALWTNAEEMGRLAGKNMAGADVKYRGFLSVMNSTEILGVPVMSAGLTEPDEKEYEVIVEDNIDSYRKLVFSDDILVGAIFIGDVTNAGIYTNLIKNKIPIGKLKDEAVKGNLQYINFMRTGYIHSAVA